MRDTAQSLLAELAALKRNDPGRHRSQAGRWIVLTMRRDLMDRVDAVLAAQAVSADSTAAQEGSGDA